MLVLFLCIVAPPTVGMPEVGDELGGGFGVHPWLRARLGGFVDEAPDSAVTEDILESVLFDHLAEIGSTSDPISFLNNPAIHIDDVERSIGGVGEIDRSEASVCGAKELGFCFLIGVAEGGEAVFDIYFRTAN